MHSPLYGSELRRLAPGAPPPEGGVLYESAGSVLVIGTAIDCAAAIDALYPRLRALLVLSPEAAPEDPIPTGADWLCGRPASIDGYLGAFRVSAETKIGSRRLSPPGGGPDTGFDLVLDLGDQPVIDRRVQPFGYFAPGGDPEALRRALTTLPALTGRFHKPRYFDYRQDTCAHGRRGQTGCERCIEACPARAIESGGAAIRIEPHLCQGCGTCSLVCPTGAVRYHRPPADELIERLWRRVTAENPAGPSAMWLCEPGSEAAARDAVEAGGVTNVVLEVLPALAALGMDAWLDLLAAGVPSLTLYTASPEHDPHLSREVDVVRRLLASMGQDPDRLVLRDVNRPAKLEGRASTGDREGDDAAPPGGAGDKRDRVLRAIARLESGASAENETVTVLPEGAPFGEVRVDRERCTLCLACVRVCPRGALRETQTGDGAPAAALAFVEEDCVQCGLCRAACPESAVTLRPRFVFDPAQRSRPRVIGESAMAACLDCGAPVASEAMTRQMEQRLRDHPLFAGDGLRRLRMCESCKARAVAGEQVTRFFGDGTGVRPPPVAGDGGD